MPVRRLLILVPLAAALIAAQPAAGVDQHSANMKIDWSFPEGPTRTHSDIAAWGNIVVAGNYDGFRVFDITQTGNNRLLLFQSVDTPQTNGETVCSQNRGSDTTACGPACFEGIRIFDLTDPTTPVYLKGVYTDCGSHTHTLIPDLPNNRLLIYVS